MINYLGVYLNQKVHIDFLYGAELVHNQEYLVHYTHERTLQEEPIT